MIYYSSQIETLENLQYVAGLIDGFNQDRFLAALMGKRNITTDKIIRMRNELNDITNRLEEEYLILEEFGKTFNDMFATRNNKCFSSAMTLLRRMRGGLSKLTHIFRQFAPTHEAARRQAHAQDQSLNLYSHSQMGGQEYTLPMFGIDEFTPQVRELYDAMKRFMEYMAKSFSLCEGVLEEEQLIRKDPEACHERYLMFKAIHAAKIKDMLDAIQLDSSAFRPENNKAIKMRIETPDERQFAAKGYHNLTESETTALASKEIVEEERQGEFSREELWLFDNRERADIRHIRHIIQFFDSFLPPDYKRQILPAKYIASLIIWCKPQEDKRFVTYFTNIYKQADGKLRVPHNSAVNQQKKDIDPSSTEYLSLVEQWKSAEFS